MIRSLLLSPGGEFLLKWTLLLAFAWLANALLLQKHARWRLILWRTVLVIGVILPAALFWPASLITIRVEGQSRVVDQPLQSISAKTPDRAERVATPTRSDPGTVALPATGTNPLLIPVAKPLPWVEILMIVWASGFGLGSLRLIWLHFRLKSLLGSARPPSGSVLTAAKAVQDCLRVSRPVRVRVSDIATSPFVCGLRCPVILLPARLLRDISDIELSALLSHEIAHLRSHDLFWSVAWRWVKAVFWFHPLVWRIPEAHLLACEQEADRIASSQWEDRSSYAQLLAQLVLQVRKLPAVETTLTMNASSQIARRLIYLKQASARPWKWIHSVAATTLSGILALVAAGWSIAKVEAASTEPPPLPLALHFSKPTIFREAVLVVQDEAGRPIAGVKLEASGFRVKGEHSSAYFWNPQRLGPRPVVTTDHDGRARVTYPVDVLPEEKLELSDVTFEISHPEFAPAQIDFTVDRGEAAPLKLTHGIHVEVSGYFGSDHQPVADLVPLLTPGPHAEQAEHWGKLPGGKMVSQQIAPGSHLLQLMGRLPSGRIVYSESTEITTKPGNSESFDLELKPGIRLEGHLDSRVPRPVTNGRAVINVRPKQVPFPRDYSRGGMEFIEKFGYISFWTSFRPVAADGTFAFESIPPGDVEVIACGDGFVSKNGNVSTVERIGIPQSFPLVAPLTVIEVSTEPSAILIVNAKTRDGIPVAGATVVTNPNVFYGFSTTLFGMTFLNSEEPFHTIDPLPFPTYSAVTDQTGVARIPNLPARTNAFDVYHPNLDVSLQQSESGRPHRDISVKLSAGKHTSVDVTLQPKGSQSLGSAASR